MTSTVNHGALIAARIDRLPVSRLTVRARLVIGAVTFFDGFDQLLIAYALPALRSEYHLGAVATTFTITVGSVGMLLGALLTGRLADRFGRVPVVLWCLLLYSLSSLFAALAPGIEWLQAARFLQGIGIGGEVLVAATYISEIIGPRSRGRFVLVYELAFVAGLAAASLVSAWVVPVFGWRVLFAVGALPVLLAIALRTVPESPRWLAARGRHQEAEAVVDRFEASARRQFGPLPDPAAAPAPPVSAGDSASVLDLFRGRYLRRTVVVSVLWFVSFLVNYGLTSWLPTIYTSVFHLDVGTSLTYSMITTVAGFAGSILIAVSVDRVGRRAGLITGLSGGAVVLTAAALVAPATGLGVLLFVSTAAFFVFAVNLALNLYGPELYPTRSRAAGASIGGVFARLGVITGPIITGLAVGTGGGITPVFAVLAVASVLGALTVALYGVETARRPLETLSP
ncbi:MULTISPECIES: MFS transporter [unclassified Crossiella]|uniref:MFS transporter n=1 Tax=unclassified Crossiella TaxID=2620835 RepID=UPI001FFF201C|nr:MULTISPECIES: MFS transporter [unclassified Crossiella]MCK2239056.1 MFS transporter [Crossiella sp. S99.2]MCK2251375.1 MFS transporter [Crossiella sp. S99.1]